jgi:hypothetical protein
MSIASSNISADFYVCTISDTYALVCWEQDVFGQRWQLINSFGAYGPAHNIAGTYIKSQPWVMNGHCYAASLEGNQSPDSHSRFATTMCCVELDVDATSTVNGFKTCLPVANWYTDIGSTLCRITAYQYDGKSFAGP